MKVLLILVAVGIAAMLFLRKKPARRTGKTTTRKPIKTAAKKQAGRVGTTPAPEKSAFRCTSIKAAGNACDEAKKLKGKRYLHSEVPSLPLAACDVARCDCRYVHHVDRRTGILDHRRNRVSEDELPSDSDLEDQRSGRGRRASDWIAAYQLNIPPG